MSVYTIVALEDLSPLLDPCAIGDPIALEGITEGVVNTNYRLVTQKGYYILTLIEDRSADRAQERALPYITALMEHLACQGVPCPLPIRGSDGLVVRRLKERPLLLVNLLPGRSPTTITPQLCTQVGEQLARMHLAVDGFSLQRPNPMGLATWETILERLTPILATSDPDTLILLRETLAELRDTWPNLELPEGACHADFFPDNTLFDHDRLTGVIDFHYACQERLIYDLAIALDAWCHDPNGRASLPRWKALLAGYNSLRPITPEEQQALPIALKASSLRFSLTRLDAAIFPRGGDQVTRKPPNEYLQRLARRRGE